MAIATSLIGDTVALGDTTVSAWINSVSYSALAVNLIDGVSLTGGPPPAPPPHGTPPEYNFSKPSNSFYITTTAF